MIVSKICFTIPFLFVQIINCTMKVRQQSPSFLVYWDIYWFLQYLYFYMYLNFLTPDTSALARPCSDIVTLRRFEFRDWGHKLCNSNALRVWSWSVYLHSNNSEHSYNLVIKVNRIHVLWDAMTLYFIKVYWVNFQGFLEIKFTFY